MVSNFHLHRIACSIWHLSRVLPYTERQRQAQLISCADRMLADLDNGNREPMASAYLEDCLTDIAAHVQYLEEAVNRIMAELPSHFVHPSK
jgi:hypothetical protein